MLIVWPALYDPFAVLEVKETMVGAVVSITTAVPVPIAFAPVGNVVDVIGLPAVSRTVPVSKTQNVELRLEGFNVTNHFNWGQPVANLLAATFGRVLSMSGDPRILQFGIKYAF